MGGWWWWGVKVPMVMTPSCASWAGQPAGCSQSTRGTSGVPGTSGRGCEAGKRDGSRSFPLHLSPARPWGHFPSKGCDLFCFSGKSSSCRDVFNKITLYLYEGTVFQIFPPISLFFPRLPCVPSLIINNGLSLPPNSYFIYFPHHSV